MKTPNLQPLFIQRNYVDLEICISIFNKCNGVQFEAATKLDLAEFFNLRTPLTPVQILPRENLRMCYLINQLYKHALPANIQTRNAWLKGILQNCGINERYYKSHYNEIDGKMGSEANKDFFHTVKSIIGA